MGALDMPSPGGLDRRLGPLARDLTAQLPLVEHGTGLVRVVAGVEVDGDLVGQRPKSLQEIESWRQERRVVAVGAGQDAAERDAVAIGHPGPFHALLAPVDG
ncbi:hypothetical protein GCM10010430_66730 [Kitasatospora cystarginea]|uniref:Uncharacterized protein n=1 Tax=Kitasatospora cystarginea TaxID=58350 RepID=A0ABP5RR10_9ACTN